ncbi:alpha-amylase family glycosyl hydrolase [Verrucomicrobium sp. BvORR106]|uniref:alpha-amylase family glycosyl hydrolase n=1 Tax=Verrucomicrobium sp. BvORR106 TaxID=1403819 RepID=UPI00068E5351|nr:alpha-amylase family glycosyl hydrolase [Verrucomicrobium sp. BvORR106]
MNTPELDAAQLTPLTPEEIDFRGEVIYFIVVDRFYDGNPSNLAGNHELNDPSHQDWDKYWGGDLQGVLDKLDYLQKTGVTAIWLTPLFEQVEALECGKLRAPIHGYWTRDFKRINARWLNDPDECSLFQCKHTLFDRLLAELHERGMKFVLDIVCNHSSPSTTEGKGKLYDDGRLVADHENDVDHWYHHYGDVTDWQDEWQIQNKDVAGLATFNENNIRYRRYIKEAIKLWLSRGVDALRIDTVKHMPLWFWQEFVTDMHTFKPDVFVFGEWIDSHPDNAMAMEYANEDGMCLLDFALCHAIRDCLGKRNEEGFHLVQEILGMDERYRSATELVTFIENHDMPRFQSLNPEREWLHLALVLLLTVRGIPCLYYGCEQYLYSNLEGGGDPYNRPMMKDWEDTEARRITRILGAERKSNSAVQWGGVWPKLVERDVYVFLRRYRDSRCMVVLNRGVARDLFLHDLEMPDGSYECILTGKKLVVDGGRAKLHVNSLEALVFTIRGKPFKARVMVNVQVDGILTKPGDRVGIVGDCSELGEWDLQHIQYLECVNNNTWFGEIAFEESCGRPLAYKYVVLNSDNLDDAKREHRSPRRRTVPETGAAKWRDRWQM